MIKKVKTLFLQLFPLLIITVPTILPLLHTGYFSMHDDQHIARLYLLDQGIKQGTLYPRWVDMLGFGFGYPLFNFYPPLIYYIAEVFHVMGFSLIWSIKCMVLTGFVLGAIGMYYLAKPYIGKAAGFVASFFYTYAIYHAVLVYVRGAFAESFALGLLPFVFLSLQKIYKNASTKNAVYFGTTLALLILTHPLVAIPTSIYIGFFFIFYVFLNFKSDAIDKINQLVKFVKKIVLGVVFGLGLSAFFWIPSIIEKKYTLVDRILTGELANYKLHYVFPQQLWYSPWGYGGSAQGMNDGMSFQLGKIFIVLTLMSFIFYVIYYFYKERMDEEKKKEMSERSSYYPLIIVCLLFSIYMATPYSSFIWDRLPVLWFLQFPWRFLTFVAFFISICCGYFLFFISHIFKKLNTKKTLIILGLAISLLPLFFYQKYFAPQRYIYTPDALRTNYEEIAWRISRTSYEFVPKEVITKKTELGTTVVDIEKDELQKKPYEIISGSADVKIVKNNFNEKIFNISAQTPIIFRLNTYNFPGWRAYLASGLPGGGRLAPRSLGEAEMDSSGVAEIVISDINSYKLITVEIPQGEHLIEFRFEDTPIRKLGNAITVITLIIVLFNFAKRKFDLRADS